MINSTSAERVLDCLDNLCTKHDFPISLASYNGPQSAATYLNNTLTEKVSCTGEIECQNHALLKRLRIANIKKKHKKHEN